MKTVIIVVILMVIFGGGIYWVFFRVEEGQEKSPAEQAFYVATGLQAVEKKAEADPELAFISAKALFKQKLLEDADLSSGSCLSNAIIPGWVADLVHEPREPVDDLPENQCAAYLSGEVVHIVELNLNGDLVRAE